MLEHPPTVQTLLPRIRTMAIVAHDFDGKQINQLLEDTIIAGKTIPKGYCNGTEMCKANGKKFNDYTRLKRSTAYIEALSRSTGIPVDVLMVEITTGINEERGTWIHPEIAISLSAWISPEFEVWSNQILRRVINGEFEALTEEAKEAQAKLIDLWNQVRNSGKTKRRKLTDSIKDWLMYAQTTNSIYISLWQKEAIDIEKEIGCGRNQLRNHLSIESLEELERAESNVTEYIDCDNIKPVDAVSLANIRKKSLTFR